MLINKIKRDFKYNRKYSNISAFSCQQIPCSMRSPLTSLNKLRRIAMTCTIIKGK